MSRRLTEIGKILPRFRDDSVSFRVVLAAGGCGGGVAALLQHLVVTIP
ncbi:hypothetical protein [Meinhardsimonia xiamenensis]|jgi:hypothetical protein|nr:hypothetical protein [Meinhardsimonia xiamenensis]